MPVITVLKIVIYYASIYFCFVSQGRNWPTEFQSKFSARSSDQVAADWDVQVNLIDIKRPCVRDMTIILEKHRKQNEFNVPKKYGPVTRPGNVNSTITHDCKYFLRILRGIPSLQIPQFS